MPTPEKFLSSFGFIVNSQFDGYILTEATATHTSVKRYQEYEYNIELIFYDIGNGQWENLFNILKNNISKEHIIKGQRNSYKCIIDYPSYGDAYQDNDYIRLSLIGHSYRI